jgi:TPR repeat protein
MLLAAFTLNPTSALRQGHGGAANKMGLAYEHGTSVPQDAVGAAEWYRRGAQRGHAPAQTNLVRPPGCPGTCD